jgi:hypothetical protein
MAKRREGEKRAQLCFMRPEDLRLFAFLEKRAYEARYEISTYILVSLHEAFKGQIEEEEVDALAKEAASKVRARTQQPMSGEEITDLIAEKANGRSVAITFDPPIEPPPAKPAKLSMEQAAQMAEAEIAKLDAIASTVMKKRVVRKGVPVPPPLPQ